MKKIIALAFICAVFLFFNFSCATIPTAKISSEEAQCHHIKNEIFVQTPFEQAWDKLVKELATQFYVINNIDKESRLINISFYSDTPELFITGGKTNREFEQNGIVEHFSYDPVASSSYKLGWKWGPFHNLPAIGTINRRTSLEGRANIYVAPEGEGTKVTVNCRYILTVHVTGTYTGENAFGNPVDKGSLPSTTVTASCNTNTPTKFNWGTPSEPYWGTICSTGKFETDILSILQ